MSRYSCTSGVCPRLSCKDGVLGVGGEQRCANGPASAAWGVAKALDALDPHKNLTSQFWHNYLHCRTLHYPTVCLLVALVLNQHYQAASELYLYPAACLQ